MRGWRRDIGEMPDSTRLQAIWFRGRIAVVGYCEDAGFNHRGYVPGDAVNQKVIKVW